MKLLSRLSLGILALALSACASGERTGEPSSKPIAPSSAAGAWSPYASFTNGGFEADDIGDPPSSWTVSSYLNPNNTGLVAVPPSSIADLDLRAGGIPLTTVVGDPTVESQPDPELGAGESLRYPKYETRTVVVNGTTNGKNRNVNLITQQMILDAGDVDPDDGNIHIRFVAAPVLENPGHADDQQPYFYIQVTNLTTNTVLYTNFNFANQDGVPWHDDGNDVLYTDWALIDVAPGANASLGDNIELRVYAAGCALGGHWGRVYVDSFGTIIPGIYVSGSGPLTSPDDADITYTLRYRNGGSTTTTNNIVRFATPLNTTFQSVSIGGCTDPGVGNTGDVTCNVGGLNAGDAGNFTVTVHVDPGTSGTVTAGNYEISADSVSPLLGSRIDTAIVGAPDTIEVVSGTPQSAALNTAFSSELVAIVKDSLGVPIPGVTVVFTPPGAGASATFSGSMVTNAAGKVFVTATANATIGGPYTVEASTAGVVGTADFSLTNTVGAPASIEVVSGSDQSQQISTAFDDPLVVLVKDAGDNPVPGVTVTFTAPGAGASATFSGSTTTDVNGQVSITATANSTAGGPYTVEASVAGVVATADFSLTNLVGPAASIAVVSGGTQSTTVMTAFGAPLVVVVKDSGNNLLSGINVTFTPPSSGASATLSGTTTTNGSGQVSITANANSVAGGPYVVAASVAGVVTPANFSLTNTPGAAASVSITGGNSQSTTVNTAFGTPLAVLVTDAYGNGVSGVNVTYTPPGVGASASITGSPATTNGSGQASVTATANTTAGSYSVNAAAAGVVSTVNFSLTNTAGSNSTISVVSGSSQSTEVLTAFADPLVVQVEDSYGNPIAGAAVTFTPPGSGASASFSGSTTTNGSGQVSVTATANGTAGGPYTVSASVSGVVATADFSLTNTAGDAASISVVSGSNQTTQVVTVFGDPLVVIVRDAQGNPVPGAAVSFAPPSSGASASLSLSTPLTDSAGNASVTATANTLAGGPYAVTASVAGVASPATFNLTNTPGAAASLRLISGGIQTTEVYTQFAAALVVEALDSYGNVVPGADVNWSAPGSGASATPSDTDTTTDSSGRTSITATANGTTGTYPLTASLSGGQQADFILTNSDVPAIRIIAESGTPQSTVVATAFGAPLRVRVRSGADPVVGAIVTFQFPSSGATAVLSSITAVTDSTGHAQVNATAGLLIGTYSVTASVVGSSQPASFALTNTAGDPVSIIASPASTPQNAQTGNSFAVPLVAIVTDLYGNPVSGVDVTFDAPGSSPSATLSTGAPVATDSNGRAEVTAIADGTTGTYTVSATATGVVGSADFELGNLVTAPLSIALVTGSPQSTVVNTAFAQPLVAVVTDGNGEPVVGIAVSTTPPASGASAAITGTNTTDGSGEVSLTATANTVAGGYEVIATVADGAAPARFVLTNLPGAPASITASVAATPQSAMVTTPYALPLLITVLDGFGNPVPGVTVTYTAPGSGATATLTSTSPTTDASGHASVVAIASEVTGTFNVDASTAGVATPATFVLTNLSDDPASIAITSGQSQTTVATTDFPELIEVLVTDVLGNPVPDAVIAITVPSEGPSASADTFELVTDANGLASTQLTANDQLGSFEASFSVSGASAPVVASLTITEIPTTTTLTINPEEPTIDDEPTLTAVVSSELSVPTGVVRFVVDGVTIGTVTLNDGAASLTGSLPAVGENEITAVYDAQGPYGASQASLMIVTVQPDSGVLDGAGCGRVRGNGSMAILLASLATWLLLLRRRSRTLVPAALCAVATLLVPELGNAQAVPGAAIDVFHTAPAGSDWFALDSLDLRGNARPAARMLIDYAHNPLVVYNRNTSQRIVVVTDQLWLNLGLGLNLFDRLRLSVNAPIAMYQDYNPTIFNGVRINPDSNAGVGDLQLAGEFRLWGAYGDPMTVAGGVAITLPTGSQSDLLGDGKVGAFPHLSAAGEVGRYAYATHVGVDFRSAEISNVNFNREFRFAMSLGARFFDRKLLIGPEMYGLVDLGQSPGKDRALGLEAILGFHYWMCPDWQLSLGAGGGIVRSAGVPDERVLASLQWMPGVRAEPTPTPTPTPTPEPTPPPVAEVTPTPAPVPLKKIELLGKVLFDTDKATIKEVSFPILDNVVEVLKGNPEIKRVRIEAHTDNMSSDAYNLSLSNRRAASVKTYLVEHGIAADRLESEGFGESRPIDTNDTRAGRSNNRRVEFVILE